MSYQACTRDKDTSCLQAHVDVQASQCPGRHFRDHFRCSRYVSASLMTSYASRIGHGLLCIPSFQWLEGQAPSKSIYTAFSKALKHQESMSGPLNVTCMPRTGECTDFHIHAAVTPAALHQVAIVLSRVTLQGILNVTWQHIIGDAQCCVAGDKNAASWNAMALQQRSGYNRHSFQLGVMLNTLSRYGVRAR